MTEGKLSKKEVWEAMRMCCDHWDLAGENISSEMYAWQVLTLQQLILAEAWLDKEKIEYCSQSLQEALHIVGLSYLMFKREGYYYEGE